MRTLVDEFNAVLFPQLEPLGCHELILNALQHYMAFYWGTRGLLVQLELSQYPVIAERSVCSLRLTVDARLIPGSIGLGNTYITEYVEQLFEPLKWQAVGGVYSPINSPTLYFSHELRYEVTCWHQIDRSSIIKLAAILGALPLSAAPLILHFSKLVLSFPAYRDVLLAQFDLDQALTKVYV